MRGAKLFLDAVVRQGVSKAFGIVGGEAAAIRFDEVKGLDFYLTRHEFAAGIMADVYGRLIGRPQMCYSTFGPGLTNMLTGVCSAVLDRSPMLAVSAQIVRTERAYNWTHQCIDNVAVMKPLVKYAHEIDNLEEIPAVVTEALKAAREEVSGPSFISFPLDLMKEEIDDAIGERLLDRMDSTEPPPPPTVDRAELKWLAEQIRQAKRPIAIGGNPIIREGATEDLLAFVEAWDIPLITTLASKGLIPESHPLLVGTVNKYLNGILSYPVLDELFENRDLVLLLGYDFGEDLKPVLWERNNGVRSLALSNVPNPMGDIFQPEHEVIGSLKTGLRLLAEMSSKRALTCDEDKRLIADLKHRKAQAGQSSHPEYPTVSVLEVVRTVRKIIGPSGILCSDIGLHKQYAGLFSNTYEPNTFMCSNGAGSFGFGLPAAMAAKLAFPNRRVAVICGDGGFHSTSQDLETAKRYNLPFVIVLLKDNSFGLIKYYQLTDKPETFPGSVDFGEVDFVRLAQANGWEGHIITNEASLQDRMQEAFDRNISVLLEIPIRYQYRFSAPTGGAVPEKR